jgi:hypothetical protein
MNSSNVKVTITFSPNTQQMKSIEQWLKREYVKHNEGFYSNWNSIKISVTKNQVAVLLLEDKPIGFIVWDYSSDLTAIIEIINIKLDRKGSGFGKFLLEKLLAHFTEQGMYAIEVECISEDSEAFARRLGFTDFPEKLEKLYSGSGNKQLYKLLLPSLASGVTLDFQETIEVWDDEPFRAKHNGPTWIWFVRFKDGTRKLVEPIVHPAYYDWTIRWKINQDELFHEKVKRFAEGNFAFGKFVIIRDLPEPK